ncbi:MAG TPA: PAS domain-containing sensor histidine kinase [Sphingobacteriaceae bacterium]
MQSEKDTIETLRAEIERLKAEHKQTIDTLRDTSRVNELYKESQIRFRTVFEHSTLGNKIISSDLKIIQVNQALLDMLGYSKEELIGSHILDFAHPAFKNDWFLLQQQLWQRQRPSFRLETCLQRKDGSYFDCNVTTILFIDEGETFGYTIIEDITERKKTEATLHRNEETLKFIMEHIPQKIFTANPNGEVIFYNPQWEVFTGYPLQEIESWGWTQFIHPEDVEDTINQWQDRLNDGKPYEIQHRFRGKNGSYCWHLTRALPITNKDGKIIQWVGSSTNLDEQKKAEERKDEFISIASHELKTPLTNIKAYNQVLLKLIDPKDSKYRFVKKSSEQIGRLQKLISDLLDVTKINAGKVTYNIEEFNFIDAVKESIESIQDTNQTHQIILETAEDTRFRGDKVRIEQVLNNFLTNAIKYSPKADKVIVRSVVDSNSIIVSVQDFGIGIAPEDVGKLFNRYYRVEKTANHYQGLGLGLFIVSEILKRHKGTFWIESEPGKGSTFFFQLPLGPEADEQVESTNTAYRDNHIEIRYNKATEMIYADWKGFQTFDSIMKGCLLILDLLKKNGCSKVLNDNTHVRGTWSDAAEWAGKQWFPLMEEAGLKYFAWIYSPSRFSQLSADKVMAETTPGSVVTRFFHDYIQGEAWLVNITRESGAMSE